MTIALLVALTFLVSAFVAISPGIHPAKNPATSKAYTPHAVISINGDASFADQGWPGDGTVGNPYVIENLDIDGSSYRDAITIGNTTAYFAIRGCYLHNSDEAGILLYNVQNGLLANNTCSGNSPNGILLSSTNETRLENNTCSSNSKYGIHLWKSNTNILVDNALSSNSFGLTLERSDFNQLIRNNLTGTGDGIILYSSSSNVLSWNNCSFRLGSGIELRQSGGESAVNVLANNTCQSNANSGIYIDSEWNIVRYNNCSYNTQSGIYGYSSEGSTVTHNSCSWNMQNGIALGNPLNSSVAFNNCSDNGGEGIVLFDNLFSNAQGIVNNNTCLRNVGTGIVLAGGSLSAIGKYRVENNTCSANKAGGIDLWLTFSNVVANNTCIDNDLYGIFILGSFSNTLIDNNFSDNNGTGVYLERSVGHETWNPYSHVIVSNTCMHNRGYGLRANYGSSTSIISNTISDNSLGGVYLSQCDQTILTGNSLAYDSKIGIVIDNSVSSTLRTNSLVDEGVLLLGDTIQEWGLQDIDESNLANGKPIFYLADGVGDTIPVNPGQVILANCRLMTIDRCNLSNASAGIQLGFCQNITATNNTCSSGLYGIMLTSSTNISIHGNVISDNVGYGMTILSGSQNKAWNNTLIGNNGATSVRSPSHVQACDNGSANEWNATSTGNYWSDWLSPDVEPNGIVDIPYDLDGTASARDNFPLTALPAAPPEPIPEFGTIAPMVVVSAFVLLVCGLRFVRKKN
jgi:parallel beta-helix repeat protein